MTLGPFLRIVLVVGALLPAVLQAQPPARPPGVGRPAIGRLYGRVLDASTRTPAEFAAVTVLAADKDSVLGGGLVQGNGDFSVERLPLGPLRVRIAFMGYKNLEQRAVLTPEASEKDLGNLLLEPDQVMLQEAEVVRDKATTMMQVDRRVFNVEKDLSAQGGNAVDVVKNVPGLSVDVDGNVQLRGGNPLVLIDGKPTTLSLEDLPAGEIERIEVITNPSVAFDAGTSGGIVNVVLKKNSKPGYYGNVQLGAGTNDRYQGGLNLNMREGRWGFNLSYNYNTAANRTDARTDREDLRNGTVIGRFDQVTDASGKRAGHGGRLGADVRIDNRNTISFSQSARWRAMDSDDHQAFTGTSSLTGDTWGTQRNTEDNRNASLTSQLGFRHTAPKQGKEWTADLTYNRWDRNSEAAYNTATFMGDAQLPGSPRLQENMGGSDLNEFTLQFDAVDPIDERDRIEWGLKADRTDDHTWLDVTMTTPDLGTRRDTALSNDYGITNMINAAYFNWTHAFSERWSMQGGLRFEQSWYDITMSGREGDFGYRYPDGTKDLAKALFPAVYFSRKWADSRRELQINFSRKIDRPRFWQVSPFVMSSDSRNVRIGNPTLAPELSNLVEVDHLLPFLKGKATWFTSLFGKYTQDVITSYSSPLPTDTTMLLNTFVNGDHSVSAGWENMVKFEPGKGPQLTLSGTVRYVDIGLGDGGLRNQGINWSAKAMVNYRLRKDLVVQVNGEYEGPRIQPQGRTLDQYGVDASMNYDLTKSLSLVAAVNDIFFTRRWGTVLDTPYLYQESYRRRDMRNFRVTLTWKFGQQDTSLFHRRQQQPQRDPGGNGGEPEGY